MYSRQEQSISLTDTCACAMPIFAQNCKFQPRSTASLNLETEIRLPKPLAPSAHCIELLEFVPTIFELNASFHGVNPAMAIGGRSTRICCVVHSEIMFEC